MGKSSVINSLTHRKRLPYVGQRPGKTRLANFYEVNERLVFVDVQDMVLPIDRNKNKKIMHFLWNPIFLNVLFI